MTYIQSQSSSGYTGSEFVVYQHINTSAYQWGFVNQSNYSGNPMIEGAYKPIQHAEYGYNPGYMFHRVFETPGYTATSYGSRSVYLAPNKKIMVEYQLLMTHLDVTPSLYIDWSFGFTSKKVGSDSSHFMNKYSSSNGFVDATVHYENFSRQGAESSYRSPIGKKIISHSESGNRNIVMHVDSSSDYNSSVLRGISSWDATYNASIGSWIKITEIE